MRASWGTANRALELRLRRDLIDRSNVETLATRLVMTGMDVEDLR
jgi:hypothetical protein